MAVTPISSYKTTTRITGLSSGMDTESIITSLMKTEQAKVDRYFKANTKLEWKKEAYTDVNTQLRTFREKFMSATSADNVFSQNVFKAYKINMAESKYMSVKATSTAAISSHKVTAARIAESATLEGVKGRNRSAQSAAATGNNKTYETQGARAIYEPDQALDKQISELTTDGTTPAFENLSASGAKLDFWISGQHFSFEKTATLRDVMTEVNNRQGLNATMSFDESTGKISLKGDGAGDSAKLVLTDSGNNKAFGTDGLFSNVEQGVVQGVNAAADPANTTIGQLAEKTGRSSTLVGGFLRFSINGEEFGFSSNTKINDMISAINSRKDAKVEASYDAAKDEIVFKSTTTGNGSKLDLKNARGSVAFGNNSFFGIPEMNASGYQEINRATDTIADAASKMGVKLSTDADGMFRFAVNGKTFAFSTSATLQSMIDKVNGDSELNVNMSYSQITDSFVFASKDTGGAAKITVSNVGASNAFGINNASGGNSSFFGIEAGSASGKDAMIRIDGEDVYRSSNSFTIDGMVFDLKMNFNMDKDVDELKDDDIINFSVSQDVDSVVDKVKKFVEEYNTLIKSYAEMIKQERDYNYEPLSESERSALSEEDRKLWEDKAKQGLMRNDSTIAGLLSSMRTAMFEKVGDTGLSPSDIGFSTANFFDAVLLGTGDGQIVFNEDKFRSAMTANPDAVSKVMANISGSEDKGVARAESGFITRLYDSMVETEKQISTVNLVNTNSSISKNEDIMNDLIKKMYSMEEKYYLQFANMETLLTQYQQQSTWLSNQLSALLGST